MRIAILDPAAGISGDMLLGALVGAGLGEDWLTGLPARVGVPHVRVRLRAVDRCGLRAMKVDFDIPETHDPPHHAHGRSVAALIRLVEAAEVAPRVAERAVHAFELLGQVEGRVHGVPPLEVHLHEVGAVDAVLDIVGVLEGFDRLGVDAVYNLPVAVGSGWVNAAHGALPIPAPATIDLLEGVEVASGGPVVGEATTPTGAVLLRVLSQGAPPARWRVRGTSWGAGTRDEPTYPNALRLIMADTAAEAGIVEVLATDIDDLTPEYLEPLREAVFAAGALDCQIWPTQGKKGRVSFRIEVLTGLEESESVIHALFKHGRTAGVRRMATWRSTLDRRTVQVELAGRHRVGIKVWDGPGGRRLKAEYEDVRSAAEALGRPAGDVAREAENLAATIDIVDSDGHERTS
ncbi:MAG: hypothetical protein AMS20_09070 [Gemmatimonas sp. SG8_28]|nr:MAG: hypothetical protein AMS20_09070 [Gemmatimonas sp. SG8_28]